MAKKVEKVAKMSVHKPSADMIAAAAGAKVRTVYAYRQGKRITGKKAKQIAIAEDLLGVGMGKLVESVRQAVKI